MSQPQKCTYWEKKAQKLKNVLFLHFMTTFHAFALKVETM